MTIYVILLQLSALLCLAQVGSIDNEYRVFQMELIAGDPQLETEVQQHGARFKLDFSQVGLGEADRKLRVAGGSWGEA